MHWSYGLKTLKKTFFALSKKKLIFCPSSSVLPTLIVHIVIECPLAFLAAHAHIFGMKIELF